MPARKLAPILALVTLLLCLSLSSPPHWSGLSPALAQGPDGQSVPNELVYNEQQTVYLTHLKRAWVRYTDNAGTFFAITEATTTRSQLQVSPASLSFMGDYTTTVPATQTLTVGYGEGCGRSPWLTPPACRRGPTTPR
jgi:hypothetical protein